MSNYAGFPAKGFRKRAEGWGAELGDARVLGGPLAGASFVAGVAWALGLLGAPYPRARAGPAEVRRYFNGNTGAARLSAAGQLVSAASLAQFTASVAGLASGSGLGSRWLRVAAVAGGALDAASLATSALCAAG